METIVTPLLNAGIPGAMAGAFIYFCWHVLTKTLPEQRAEFIATIKELRAEAQATLTAQTVAHERSLSRLADAVTALSAEVRAVTAQRLAERGEG
jgi:hypothetical protein